MPAILAYWDIRGLAQAIRLLLNYCGEEFEDKQYVCGEGPEYNKECWLSVKYSLGLDFPNLPYYIDGDVKITQTNAILRYIGRKYNMCGETDEERASVDMMLENAMDFRNPWVKFCYSTYTTQKEAYLKALKAKLDQFSKYLGDKPWFSGNKITFPDFHMYELLDQHRKLLPGCLDGHTTLLDYLDRFEALPAIATYMASDKFMASPSNNRMALLGAK